MMPPGSMGPGGMPPGSVGPGMMPGTMGPGMMPGTMGPSMMPGSMGPGMMPGSMGPGMMPGTMGPSMMPGMGPPMMPGSMGPGMMPGSMGPGMMPGGMGPGMMPGSMGPGMMPGSMGPGMMPGSMGPGMMPGSMGPGMMGMGRTGIALQEMPNQRMLDSQMMPMAPQPWQGSQMALLPGQATGYGSQNLSPMQQQSLPQGQIERLPNAYRMYGYGPREITWSSPVPVPEGQNTGVMINAEFPLSKELEGREVYPSDTGIRNMGWQQQGEWVKPFDPVRDVPDWKHKMFGSYEDACDMKRPMHKKDHMEIYYTGLAKERNTKGLFAENQQPGKQGMSLEIMDDQELNAFWANPEAVMQDRLE